MILMQERMKDRAKVYVKFVRIAEHLRRMNNYHTLMGIVAGLNMGAVNRLKHTLNAVGPELQNVRLRFFSLSSFVALSVCMPFVFFWLHPLCFFVYTLISSFLFLFSNMLATFYRCSRSW